LPLQKGLEEIQRRAPYALPRAGDAGRSAAEMMMKNIAIAVAVIVAIIALAIAALSLMQLQASNTLLRKIRLVKPGVYLPSVTNELGRMM
jgi:hypothetical protein